MSIDINIIMEGAEGLDVSLLWRPPMDDPVGLLSSFTFEFFDGATTYEEITVPKDSVQTIGGYPMLVLNGNYCHLFPEFPAGSYVIPTSWVKLFWKNDRDDPEETESETWARVVQWYTYVDVNPETFERYNVNRIQFDGLESGLINKITKIWLWKDVDNWNTDIEKKHYQYFTVGETGYTSYYRPVQVEKVELFTSTDSKVKVSEIKNEWYGGSTVHPSPTEGEDPYDGVSENTKRWDRKPLCKIYGRLKSLHDTYITSDGTYNIRIDLKKGEEAKDKLKTCANRIIDGGSSFKAVEGDIPYPDTYNCKTDDQPLEYKASNIDTAANHYIKVSEIGTGSKYRYMKCDGSEPTEQQIEAGGKDFRIDCYEDKIDCEGIFFSWFDTFDTDNFKVTTQPRYDADEVNGRFVSPNKTYQIYLMPRRWAYYSRVREANALKASEAEESLSQNPIIYQSVEIDYGTCCTTQYPEDIGKPCASLGTVTSSEYTPPSEEKDPCIDFFDTSVLVDHTIVIDVDCLAYYSLYDPEHPEWSVPTYGTKTITNTWTVSRHPTSAPTWRQDTTRIGLWWDRPPNNILPMSSMGKYTHIYDVGKDGPRWATETSYVTGQAVTNGPFTSTDDTTKLDFYMSCVPYMCIADHTSDSTTEPGKGTYWEDYWERYYYQDYFFLEPSWEYDPDDLDDWTKEDDKIYQRGDRVKNSTIPYLCKITHTAKDENEPGRGSEYGYYWKRYSEDFIAIDSDFTTWYDNKDEQNEDFEDRLSGSTFVAGDSYYHEYGSNQWPYEYSWKNLVWRDYTEDLVTLGSGGVLATGDCYDQYGNYKLAFYAASRKIFGYTSPNRSELYDVRYPTLYSSDFWTAYGPDAYYIPNGDEQEAPEDEMTLDKDDDEQIYLNYGMWDDFPIGIGISPDLAGSLVGIVRQKGSSDSFFIWRKTDEDISLTGKSINPPEPAEGEEPEEGYEPYTGHKASFESHDNDRFPRNIWDSRGHFTYDINPWTTVGFVDQFEATDFREITKYGRILSLVDKSTLATDSEEEEDPDEVEGEPICPWKYEYIRAEGGANILPAKVILMFTAEVGMRAYPGDEKIGPLKRWRRRAIALGNPYASDISGV